MRCSRKANTVHPPVAGVPVRVTPPKTPMVPAPLETWKLTGDQQLEVCRLLAEWQPVHEIIAELHATAGITLTSEAVRYYRTAPKWAPLVAQYRTNFLRDLAASPLAHKKVRLERLERLYQTTTDRVELRQLLESARRECEDSQGRDINILAITQFQGVPTDELVKQRQAVLKRLQTLEVNDAGR